MEKQEINKAKGGRPKLALNKSIKLTIRFTRQEYSVLQGKANTAGVNLSEFIRQATTKAKITPKLSVEQMESIRQLAGMATNINQVARVCHREGLYEAMRYFGQYQKQFDHILQKLKS